MAGENASSASELPSCSPFLQMHSSNSRPVSRQGGRRLLLQDAEVLSKKQLCRQPLGYVEYKASSPDADNEPQNMMSNLTSRRHSSFSLHSSSSSGESRPSSSLRKKVENSSNNWPATRDSHLPGTSSWQRSSPREHRQSICLPSTANSHSEDSADELSPRQLQSKTFLSKYKPLPAIRGKNHGTPSPDILRIPTDCQIEDIVTHTQYNTSPHKPESLTIGLKRESSWLPDRDYPKQTNKHLANVRLDLEVSSPNPIQPDENYEELLSPRICPPISTSWPELPGLTDLPAEPGPEEARTLLAVKLPNGQRVHRFFRLTDPLWLVRRFAEVSSSSDFANFQLVKSVPREILDLEQTIEENHLLEKMLLHLECPPSMES